MALARFGGGVSELRGSIAGNVYSRSRAGAIVRNRAVPVNPNTPAQSEVRARLQSATDGFKELEKLAVVAWNDFAATQERTNRLGETYVPSGKQLFTEAAMNLMNLNDDGSSFASLAALIVNPNLPALSPFSLSMEITGTNLTEFDIVDADGDANATNIIIQATLPMLASISNRKKYFRQIVIPALDPSVDFHLGYTATYPITTGVWDTFQGLVVAVRARALNSDTGLAGDWIYADIEVPSPA